MLSASTFQGGWSGDTSAENALQRQHGADLATRAARKEHQGVQQSAIPAGVFNADEDSDDEDAYLGEQKELQKEMQELLAAKDWINQKGWDVASEALVVSPSSGKTIDLRLDWAIVERKLKQGCGDLAVSDAGDVDEAKVLADFSLDKLDPTQRVCADRVIGDILVIAPPVEHKITCRVITASIIHCRCDKPLRRSHIVLRLML